jgi:hypothetical protein
LPPARLRSLALVEEATMVRLPDAAGQVTSAPVKAIRGFFAGIGQLLLAADRFRAEEAERERADEEQHDPLTTAMRQPAVRDGQPAEPRRFRSLDSTGNVRVLTAAEVAAEVAAEAAAEAETAEAETADVSPEPDQPEAGQPETAGGSAAAGSSAAGPRTGTRAAVAAVPAARTAPEPAASAQAPAAQAPAAQAPAVAPEPSAAASLPVPGYDGLSLPSLRSRLRVLDAAQLRVLVDYEKSHASRTDVVTMFERRIAKLEAAGHHAT